MFKIVKYLLLVSLVLLNANLAHASEFRTLRPIPTPIKGMSKGEIKVKNLPPVSNEAIKAGLNSLLASWNTPRMEKFLAQEFYDRSRLLDAMQTFPAKDARLRLLSIKDVQVMNQKVFPVDKEHVTRVSIVSVSALTQIEFEDPVKGFVKLKGENEYLLRVKEHIRLYP